jgi:hypothetical protein
MGFLQFVDAGMGGELAFEESMAALQDALNMLSWVMNLMGFWQDAGQVQNLAPEASTAPGDTAGSNDYVQTGVDNAKNALTEFSQQKLSSNCVAFLDQLGAGAPSPFTSGSLQAQAAASASFVLMGLALRPRYSVLGNLVRVPSEMLFATNPV